MSLDKAARGEALGRDVEQAQLAGRGAVERRRVGARVLLRVDERHALAETARRERLDLILHERDERRDDDREVVAQERRQLVAERLAGAGRHNDEHVAACQRRLAGLALAGPELGEAEVLVQRAGRGPWGRTGQALAPPPEGGRETSRRCRAAR